MSIRIDAEACVRCGGCADICPGGLITLDKNHAAEITRPEDCWGCASCLKECGHGAISMFLGEDISGGMAMSVRKTGDTLEWSFTGPGRDAYVIRIDRSESNKY
jgi:adenylylsulfate reductase subunit B